VNALRYCGCKHFRLGPLYRVDRLVSGCESIPNRGGSNRWSRLRSLIALTKWVGCALGIAILGWIAPFDFCFAQSPPADPSSKLANRSDSESQSPAESLEQRLKREPIEQLVRQVMRLGDPERGAAIYFDPRLNCILCHELGKRNRRLGPDLTVQRAVDAKFLIRSLLEPSREIHREYQSAIVETNDGRLWNGVLVLNGSTRLILDPARQPADLMVIDKDDIAQWRIARTSSMPEHLVDRLANRGQFLDLIRYLKTIADQGPGRAAELRPDPQSVSHSPSAETDRSAVGDR